MAIKKGRHEKHEEKIGQCSRSGRNPQKSISLFLIQRDRNNNDADIRQLRGGADIREAGQ